MRPSALIKANLAAATALILVAGCGSTGQGRREVAYVERPVETIYSDAVRSLDRRNWELAAAQFDEVQRQHPYSPWAQRALLMAAYARYKRGTVTGYEEAMKSAQEYIAVHPGGEGAPYAYYLVAICHFDQIVDVGREQGRSTLALAALNEVVQRFPETEYARDAALKIDLVRDQLAGKEMEIGRYYLRRNEHLSAINRFKNVVKTYDTTTHAPEALHRLVESYLSIGLVGEAQAAAAVLGYNYPGSEWYADTYTLMTTEGVQMEARPESDYESINWFKRAWDLIF
jgi:outer membrane protein assembly factor BamD